MVSIGIRSYQLQKLFMRQGFPYRHEPVEARLAPDTKPEVANGPHARAGQDERERTNAYTRYVVLVRDSYGTVTPASKTQFIQEFGPDVPGESYWRSTRSDRIMRAIVVTDSLIKSLGGGPEDTGLEIQDGNRRHFVNVGDIMSESGRVLEASALLTLGHADHTRDHRSDRTGNMVPTPLLRDNTQEFKRLFALYSCLDEVKNTEHEVDPATGTVPDTLMRPTLNVDARILKALGCRDAGGLYFDNQFVPMGGRIVEMSSHRFQTHAPEKNFVGDLMEEAVTHFALDHLGVTGLTGALVEQGLDQMKKKHEQTAPHHGRV